ncbi:MAG: DUF2141 domain-containing protein [Gammaproteobacteria bacterium]
MKTTIVHAFIVAGLLSAGSAGAGSIEVRVSGVDSSKGKVHVAVCDKATFLKECKYTATVPARPGETVLTVKDLPTGMWAVLCFHDENQNGVLDRNFIGIPSENYGFSRDARKPFGPPTFEQAAVEVKDAQAVVPIKLH